MTSIMESFKGKGRNYARHSNDVEHSMKLCREAFNKAVKLGHSRESLESAFREGFMEAV